MTDLEVVLSLLTILGAIVLLSLAHDAVEGWRRVGGSENGRGVEASRWCDSHRTAEPSSKKRSELWHEMPEKPGRPFSEPPRLNTFRGMAAAFGLRLSDARKQSGVAPRREAEEHVSHGTNPALVPANRRRGGLSGEGDTQPRDCPVNGGGGLSQGGPPPSLGDVP